MPAWHEVLPCFQKRREGDSKQYAQDQITAPGTGKSNRSTENRERKSALNIGGSSRHGTEGNGAQCDRGYGHCESQGDPPSKPSHARH